jgi:Zn-dependent protease with chaperone function/Zn-finger nucleic acid-binding protein
MQCPSCEELKLRPVLTKQGVELDYCDCCQGVWLDRGELFLFAKDPKKVAQNLKEGLKVQKPIGKICPVSGEPMVEFAYPGGTRLDYCPKCEGIWFDSGELQTLLAEEPSLRLTLDRATLIPPASEAGSLPPVGMVRLPNRFLSSLTVLVGMWGLFTAILIVLAHFEIISVIAALIVGVLAALLQFLVAPFSLDLTLRWLFKFRWLTSEELPAHLRQFVEQICQQRKIKFPYFGLIDDGAPQAFTYGHTPNNARIVLSRGILELLDDGEVEAVVAHEVGHAVHWDMLLMSAAQIIPLVLYYFYRLLLDAATSTKSDAKIQARITVLLGAMGAFAVYIFSEYFVLWFSRHREYYADRFSGEVSGIPGYLSSALVKIAYGLAGLEKKEGEAEESTARRAALASVKALGIFDDRMAQALAIAAYTPGLAATDQVDKANIKGAMRWDLWNPWARWYELNSTHPLVANRLRYLSDQSRLLNQEPYIVFSEAQPESYWDEFLLDLLIYLFPVLTLLMFIPLILIWYTGLYPVPVAVLPGLLAIMGIGRLLRYFFSYQGKYFPGMSVAALLKRVKVSDIRPVACTLQGTVIGRGVPGLIFSEDFVMQDETGIIFLDYRQPLAIWELLFGLLQAGSYNGKQVTVQGWYRRSPIPYVQIKTIECDGVVRKSYVPAVRRLTPFIYILAGLGWGIYLMF